MGKEIYEHCNCPECVGARNETTGNKSALSDGLSSVGEPEPLPDIAICSACGWRGKITECETEQDGTWEEGYYDIHLCPKCEDGGRIDDYDMTADRCLEWLKWSKRKAR